MKNTIQKLVMNVSLLEKVVIWIHQVIRLRMSYTLVKCIDCVENERVYGPDTEYQIGEYAHHKSGLCTVHHLIHMDVGHYDEDYCDFCEEEVNNG